MKIFHNKIIIGVICIVVDFIAFWLSWNIIPNFWQEVAY